MVVDAVGVDHLQDVPELAEVRRPLAGSDGGQGAVLDLKARDRRFAHRALPPGQSTRRPPPRNRSASSP